MGFGGAGLEASRSQVLLMFCKESPPLAQHPARVVQALRTMAYWIQPAAHVCQNGGPPYKGVSHSLSTKDFSQNPKAAEQHAAGPCDAEKKGGPM